MKERVSRDEIQREKNRDAEGAKVLGRRGHPLAPSSRLPVCRMSSSSSSEISRHIRNALTNDSSEKLLTVALNSIGTIAVEDPPPDPTGLDQLRDDIESMYQDLVDHSSTTKLERFIAILHAFLPIFRPIYVVTHWWDLVLRAALRNPRLSSKAIQHAKAITLHGLVLESSKVTEFRKRIIELFLLDAYDESSRCDALEQATMSAEERRIQQFWKHNLGALLEQLSIKRPEVCDLVLKKYLYVSYFFSTGVLE